MALTKGFKNLLVVVAIVGGIGGGAVYTHKHNYFGLADAKPKAEETAATPAIPAAPVEPTQHYELPATQQTESEPVEQPQPQPKHKRRHEQVQTPVQDEQPAPKSDSSINALKGMNSL